MPEDGFDALKKINPQTEKQASDDINKSFVSEGENTSVGLYDPEQQRAMAKRWENSILDFLQYYKAADRVMNNGRTPKASEMLQKARNQGIDTTKNKPGLKKLWKFSTGRLALAAPERFGKTFTADISKTLRALSAKYDTSSNEFKSAYNRVVVPMVRKKMGAIVRAGKIIKDNDLYISHLKNVYSLSPEDAIDAVRYLEWLEAGGAHQVGVTDTLSLNKVSSKITRAYGMFNISWSIVNLCDLGRLAAGILTDTRIKNFGDVLRVTKSILTMDNNESKAALYCLEGDVPSRDVAGASKWDFYAHTVKLQRHIAWAADKALGGDGLGFMSSHVFDYHPYEAPDMVRGSEQSRIISRLLRYRMTPAARTVRLLRIGIFGGEQGRGRAAAEMAIDWTIKITLFGILAVIPVEFVSIIKPYFNEHPPEEGMVTNAIQDMADGIFGDGKVKVKRLEGVQTPILPLGPFSAGSFYCWEELRELYYRPIMPIGLFLRNCFIEGDFIGAGLNVMTSASAVGNLIAVSPVQLTKTLQALSENRNTENPKKFPTELTKAVFGPNSAKQDDGSSSRRKQIKYVARRKIGTESSTARENAIKALKELEDKGLIKRRLP